MSPMLRTMTGSTQQLSRIFRRNDGALNYLSSIHYDCTLGGRYFVTFMVVYRQRGDMSIILALYSSAPDRVFIRDPPTLSEWKS